MTILVQIVPKTIDEDYDGIVQFKMTLIDEPGSRIAGGNYFFDINAPDLSPTTRGMIMRSGREDREQSVCFDVPSNLARGQHTFAVRGQNGRATNITSGSGNQLPDTATLTLNVNTPQTGTANGFNINWSPADTGALQPGDEIFLTMSLNGPSAHEFQYRLTADQDVFEAIDSTFIITSTEEVRTFLRIRQNAVDASGTITIVPVNNHAIGLQSLLTSSGQSTRGFGVVRPANASVDSINIAWTPVDVERGQEIFLTMSLVNPSGHPFIFRLLSNVDVFEPSDYEFTIEGDEEVRTFARIRSDALLEPGVIRIVPHNDNARAIGTTLTSSGNMHSFTVIDAAVAPEFVPSNITYDRGIVSTYFEDLLFKPGFRLPSQAAWKAKHSFNDGYYGVTLTNLRIQLDVGDTYQVAYFRLAGESDEYIKKLVNYPGSSYLKLALTEGPSSVVTIGTTQFYRFTGHAFFKVFVRQNLSAPETRIIHAELARYVIDHISARATESQYAPLTVSSPISSFGIDAIGDGWAQSNISFPYTWDIPV